MIRPGSVGLVALVVVVTVAGISGPMAIAGATSSPQEDPRRISTADHDGATGSAAFAPADIQTQEFDSTTFEIIVYENGSATWTFRHEQRLEDSEEEQNFREFAQEFESEETGLYERFTEQATALTETGSESTDRKMEATDFDRSARVEERLNPTGVIEMSFTWNGFAAVENGKVIVGDVFRDIYLTSDQSIVIGTGGDLTFERAAPDDVEYAGTDLESASEVRWSGEREFLDGHPRVILDDSSIEDAGNADGPISSLTDDEGTLSWPLLLFVVLLGLGSAVVWYRRTTDARSEGDDATPPPAGAPAAAGESEPGGDEPGPNSDASANDDLLPDEELLTDEDRVVKLIRENGGRMKQVNIVEKTGWSKSKVSMLLSDMEEEGTISKLRVGRENIISLEGFEPEATKSPFEE